MTGEVVEIEELAMPCWTSKYMAWKCIQEREKGKVSKAASLRLRGQELTAMRCRACTVIHPDSLRARHGLVPTNAERR